MALILPGNVASATADAGYNVANSCRFDGDGDSLSREIDGVDTTKLTISFWFKVCQIDGTYGNALFTSENNGGDYLFIHQNTAGNLDINLTGTANRRITTATYRDISAWYHLCVIFDSTQGTASNRVKVYINGTQVTSFSTSTDGMAEDSNLSPIDETLDYAVGTYQGQHASNSVDGYMAEVVALFGQALGPTSFGEFDSDSPTIWKPIDVSGLTFGGNSFYLDFEDSDNLGDDESGNTDDFAENNIAAGDQCVDTPTNNFATINATWADNVSVSGLTYSTGNTIWYPTVNGNTYSRSTMGMANGKWYMEMKVTEYNTGQSSSVGIVAADVFGDPLAQAYGMQVQLNASNTDFKKIVGGTVTTVNDSFSSGSIAMLAIDLDNGKMWVGYDGTWYNDDNASTTLDASNEDGSGIASKDYLIGFQAYWQTTISAYNIAEINFGNPAFAISSANADANGYGNFEFAVPSGFFALCSKNLATYG